MVNVCIRICIFAQSYNGEGENVPYGSQGRLGNAIVYFKTSFGDFPANVCWSPSPNPIVSSIYFPVFIFLAVFMVLSLFTGVVCDGMSVSLEECLEADAKKKALRLARKENSR